MAKQHNLAAVTHRPRPVGVINIMASSPLIGQPTKTNGQAPTTAAASHDADDLISKARTFEEIVGRLFAQLGTLEAALK